MRTFAISTILTAGFIIAILVINTEHRKEIDNIKEQIKTCESPGVVIFPDGEYLVVQYYSTEYFIY